MKVYIVTNVPFPNGMAPANRIKCYAGAIANAGIDCEILIYRRTERYGIAPQNVEPSGEVYGVKYKYIGGTPLRGSNVLIRRYNDYKDKQRLKLYLKNNLQNGDVLFMYMGGDVHFCIEICYLSHKLGVKCVRDLCELPYGTSVETSKAKKLRKITEQKLFPLCDGIIPISDALMQYAQQFTNNECKYQKIPILVDFDEYALKDRSGEAEYPYIFHSGTLTEQKDGILGMIEAFGMAKEKVPNNLKFICTGSKCNSRYCSDIDRLISIYNLQDNLIFTGYLEDAELRDYLQNASLVIINKYPTQQNKYCFSTKLGEYMAAGKAVIITRVGEAVNWLHEGVDCIMIEADDKQALVDNILRLYKDAELRIRLGECARMTCKNNFDYLAVSSLIKDFLYHL